MNNLNLVRGLFLITVSLIFGLTSLRYSLGQFSHAGPGLFPAFVSTLLLFIGIVTVVRSRFVPSIPLPLEFRKILIIAGSIFGFGIFSIYVNMIAGIVFMVFTSTAAGTSYSWWRNLKVAAALVALAFVLQKSLGVNLPLY